MSFSNTEDRNVPVIKKKYFCKINKSENNHFMPLILILFHVKGWKPALQ